MNLSVIFFVGFCILTILIGILSNGNSKNIQDFCAYKTNIGIIVTTVFTSWIGGEDICGIPDYACKHGIFYILVFCFGYFGKSFFMSMTFLRHLTKFNNALTIGDIVFLFYGNYGKIITGVASFFYSIGRIGAQITAIGYICEVFLHIKYEYGICLSCITMATYSSIGGAKSVGNTSVLQFFILMICSPAIGFFFIFSNSNCTDLMWFDGKIVPAVMLFFTLIMPFPGPITSQRLLMAKTEKDAINSTKIAGIFFIIFYIIMFGMSVFLLKHNSYYVTSNNLEIIKCIACTGMMAAVLSTADSAINTATVVIVYDVCGKLLRISSKKMLSYMRIFTWFICCTSSVAAIYFKDVIEISFYFSNFWIPIIISPLFAAFYDYIVTKRQFVAITITTFSFIIFLQHIIQISNSYYGILFGFILNISLIFVFDYFNKKRMRNDIRMCRL